MVNYYNSFDDIKKEPLKDYLKASFVDATSDLETHIFLVKGEDIPVDFIVKILNEGVKENFNRNPDVTLACETEDAVFKIRAYVINDYGAGLFLINEEGLVK